MYRYQSTTDKNVKVLEIVDVAQYLDAIDQEEATASPAAESSNQGKTARRSTSESAFISILFAIIISWILVALWTRTVENFAFGTLGLNGDSTVHSLIVAVAISIIFFMLVWTLDQYGVIIGGIERIVESESLIPAP